MNPEFIKRSIELATKSVAESGGPFGAVIVKDGKVLAEASNTVTRDMDPSAHAEVNAIRKACKTLKTHSLSGAEIYCSCEPCPMCLAAIYWARIEKIHFAASRFDAKAAGFDDETLYSELEKSINCRNIPTEHVELPESAAPFTAWKNKKDKVEY